MFNCLERSNLLKINQLWKNNDCLDCLGAQMYCLGGLAPPVFSHTYPSYVPKIS